MCLSGSDRTALERPKPVSKRPPGMAPVEPGWQEAEGLGVSHASNPISVEGRTPALDEHNQPNLPWEP